MTNSTVEISIIIVNYNSFKMLRECLNSIINYTKSNSYEIIVVDNNSTDGDIEEITNKFQNVTLIKNSSNMGFSAANNQAIKIASGKYLLFLNNDTKFLEDSIEKLASFLNEHNNSIMVGCKLLNNDLTIQTSIVDFDTLANLFGENFFLYLFLKKSKIFNRYNLNYREISKPIEVDVIKGAFIMAPKEKIDELGGFDERFYFYSEETDLCYRFKKEIGKIYYYPNTSIIHYGGSSTENMPWFMFKNLSIAKIQFFQKHFNNIEFLTSLIIHYLGMLIRVPLYLLSGIISFDKFQISKSYYFLKLLFIYPKNIFR